MSNKNNIIIVIVVIIAAFFAYNYLIKDQGSASDTSLTAEAKSTNFAAAKEILLLLNRMSNIKLDDSIFSDRAFQSLKDTTVTLKDQPIGRNNPFAPLSGADNSRATTTTTAPSGFPKVSR